MKTKFIISLILSLFLSTNLKAKPVSLFIRTEPETKMQHLKVKAKKRQLLSKQIKMQKRVYQRKAKLTLIKKRLG